MPSDALYSARRAHREAVEAEELSKRNYVARRNQPGTSIRTINKARDEWGLYALVRVQRWIELCAAEDRERVPPTLGELVGAAPAP